MDTYIYNNQNKKDLIDAIKNRSAPFVVTINNLPVKKNESRRKMMAFFHRSIVPAFADCAGLDEVQAKCELQTMFCRLGEVVNSDGLWDIVWFDNNGARAIEQNKVYYVRPISDLNNSELAELNDVCQNYIANTYGVIVNENTRDYRQKKIQ